MEKLKGKLTTLVIATVMLVGVGLVVYPWIASYMIAPAQLDKVTTEAMNDVTGEDMKVNLVIKRAQAGEDAFDFGEVQSLSSYTINPVIDKENVIGGLSIRSVDINLPILYGATDANMKAGVGTMKPGQEMGVGNYALAGHNARNPNILLAPIRRMNVGDEIVITDKEKVYTYKMISSEVVKPNRVDVIEDVRGETLLTLVSCYSADGSDRIIVTAELVGEEDYE